MAYQFAHVEGYGRAPGKGKKGGHTLASIVAEAERQPGACPHIEQPEEPWLVDGITPTEAAEKAAQWAEQARDSRGHKLRKDALCMLGGVVSLPAGMIDRWEAFRDDAVKWLKHEYGPRLLSVVQHDDEAHPHLHFYVVPLEGERFSEIHDGLAAAERADPRRGDRLRPKAEKTQGRKDARRAYAEAMRQWQDRFHTMARRYGLARIGPGRRRLSRDEYQAENSAREALAAQEATIAATRKAAEATRVENIVLLKSIQEHGPRVAPILSQLPQPALKRAWEAMIAVAEEERAKLARQKTRREGYER